MHRLQFGGWDFNANIHHPDTELLKYNVNKTHCATKRN
ncbi:hypothetical protein EMIT0158MI4_80105 [Burkholderia ambifaria]